MSWQSELSSYNPLVWYRLNEASGSVFAVNYGSVAVSGTYNNLANTAWNQTSLVNGGDASVTLDGVNDYVSTPHHSALGINTFTVGAWIKAPAVPAANTAIIDKRLLANNINYRLQVSSAGRPALLLTIASGAQLNATPLINICDNKTHFIVGTFDGSYIKTYIDGTLCAYTNQSGIPDTNTNAITMGCLSSLNQFFNATIDEPFIIGSSLTTPQIWSLFAAGSGFTNSFTPVTNWENTINSHNPLYWFRLGEPNNPPIDRGSLYLGALYPSSIGLAQAGAIQLDSNKSFNIDGIAPVPHILGNPSTSLFTSRFTLGCWIKTTKGGQYPSPMMWQNGTGSRRYNFYMSNGTVGFSVGDGTTNYDAVSSATYNDNNWHFLVGRFSGIPELFVDGRLVNTMVASPFVAYSGIDLSHIPMQFGTTPYSGNLDEAFYIGSALTNQQILNLYNIGADTRQLFNSGNPSTINVGDTFVYQISGNSLSTSYRAYDLPNSLGINTQNGLISGVVWSNGSYLINTQAYAPSSVSSGQFTLTIDKPSIVGTTKTQKISTTFHVPNVTPSSITYKRNSISPELDNKFTPKYYRKKYDDIVLRMKPSLYIKFEDNGGDSTEYHRSATLYNPTYQTSKDGSHCAYFNGTTSSGSIPAFNINEHNCFTINMWVKPVNTTAISGNATLFDRSPSGISMIVDQSTLKYKFTLSNVSVSSTYSIDNNWTQLTFVNDGRNIYNYVNGCVNQSGALGSAYSNNSLIVLGANTSGSNQFEGLVDDLSIWQNNLTGGDILRLYKLGKVILQ